MELSPESKYLEAGIIFPSSNCKLFTRSFDSNKEFVKLRDSVKHQIMTNIYKSTYSFSISPVQDQPIFGNLAWLGRPIDLQGLTIWNWPSQHGRAIQGHSLWESQNIMFTFTKWHFSTQYLTPKSKIVKLKNNSSLNDEPHSISHLSNHGTDLNTETTVCFTLLALFCPQPAHASSRQAHWSEKQG